MQDKDKDKKPEKPEATRPEETRDEQLKQEDLEKVSGGQATRPPQGPSGDWW